MTVADLAKIMKTSIKVMSAYNGKVLCHRFDQEKHKEIGERETDCVWADLQIIEGPFGKQAKAIICCYADGTKELLAKFNETMGADNDC